MQQKEISRWLKAITIVLALMGAVFFLYIMPVLAMSWRDADESLAYLFMPGLLYGWCIAVICYAILYQFWKVCVQIGICFGSGIITSGPESLRIKTGK